MKLSCLIVRLFYKLNSCTTLCADISELYIQVKKLHKAIVLGEIVFQSVGWNIIARKPKSSLKAHRISAEMV